MTQLGKRTKKAREGVDREHLYPVEEAVKMVKDRAKAKFDETIEVAMNLGVDPRHADQMVRGVVSLPNGSGRSVRVGVFARGAKADEARAAGADVVGAEDLVEKVQEGIGLYQLRAGRSLIDLVPVSGRLGRMGGAPPGREGRNLDHVCLRVEPFDAAAIIGHLDAHGAKHGDVETRYGADGEGPSIYVTDPEGNVVELKGPPAR